MTIADLLRKKIIVIINRGTDKNCVKLEALLHRLFNENKIFNYYWFFPAEKPIQRLTRIIAIIEPTGPAITKIKKFLQHTFQEYEIVHAER